MYYNCVSSNTFVDSYKFDVKRSEEVPVINMIVIPDTEVCNKSVEYTYEWKIYNGSSPAFYENGMYCYLLVQSMYKFKIILFLMKREILQFFFLRYSNQIILFLNGNCAVLFYGDKTLIRIIYQY